MTEDLPDPENRVSLDSSGRVVVNFRANNLKLHKRLVARWPPRCGAPAIR